MTLKSEFEANCPCCQSTLVIDTNLKRVVRHVEPVRADRPELSDATRILADEADRREALFQRSVTAEKTRGDALSKRFEEALNQARREPITKPTRDFDLD
jgi:predicted GNAT family N-acyltransferase